MDSLRGKNSVQKVEGEILYQIAMLDLEELSTLKATSNFDASWYKYDLNKTYPRSKVTEALYKYAGNEINVFALSLRALRKLEDQRCTHTDISRKPEHDGIREIYVMGIRESWVQPLCVSQPLMTRRNGTRYTLFQSLQCFYSSSLQHTCTISYSEH